MGTQRRTGLEYTASGHIDIRSTACNVTVLTLQIRDVVVSIQHGLIHSIRLQR
jgi:hypothetical protein